MKIKSLSYGEVYISLGDSKYHPLEIELYDKWDTVRAKITYPSGIVSWINLNLTLEWGYVPLEVDS